MEFCKPERDIEANRINQHGRSKILDIIFFAKRCIKESFI
jgi:hypothetical protein